MEQPLGENVASIERNPADLCVNFKLGELHAASFRSCSSPPPPQKKIINKKQNKKNRGGGGANRDLNKRWQKQIISLVHAPLLLFWWNQRSWNTKTSCSCVQKKKKKQKKKQKKHNNNKNKLIKK